MAHWVDATYLRVQHADPVTALFFLLIGMLMESTCMPLPSELVLPLAGIWAAQSGVTGLIEVEIAAVAGTLLGSAIMYAIGYYGGTPVFERYGRYVMVTPHHLEQAHHWINRYGAGAIAVARLMFGVRHVSSFAAGVLRMSFTRFILATFIGGAAWDTLGILLGYFYGEKVHTLLKHMSEGMFVAAAVIAAVAALALYRKTHSGARDRHQ